MEEQEQHYYPPKPELNESNQNNLIRSLLSLGVFVLFFYLIFDDTQVLFLVVLILFIHEMGHFIAMKIFGYNDVSMFFIPLMGAMVTGQKDRISQMQRAIIVLAGPIPGILIGYGITTYALSIGHHTMTIAGLMFVFINVLNLLPLDPLDGGKLIETLFFTTNEKVKQGFLIISLVLMIGIAILYMEPILALLGVFMFSRMRSLQNLAKIRESVKTNNIELVKTYEELSDEEYWSIRKVFLKSSKLSQMIDPELDEPSQFEDRLAISVKNILITPVNLDISIVGKIFLFLIWLGGLILPILYVYPIIEKLIL